VIGSGGVRRKRLRRRGGRRFTSESKKEMVPSVWPAHTLRLDRGEVGEKKLTLVMLVISRRRLAGRSEASERRDEWF